MGHVRDLWTRPGPSGRRVRTERHGRGKRWLAKWDEGGRTRSKAFSSKAAAEQHLARVAVDLEAGRPVGGGDVTVGQWVEAWLPRQVHWRPATLDSATVRLRKHVVPVIGHVRVGEVTRGQLQDLVAGMDLAPSSVRTAWSYVHSCLADAAAEGLMRREVLEGVRLPRAEKRRAWMPTLEEAHTVVERMPGWARIGPLVAAGTGLRPAEWAGMCWEQVDEEAGTLHVDRQLVGVAPLAWGPPKTRSSDRRIALAPETLAALLAHREEHGTGPGGLVIGGPRGGVMSKRARADLWALGSAGLGFPPRTGWHSFRHLHASLLIRGGLSVVAVAHRLGHSGPAETLETYAHLWQDDETRAMAVVSEHLGGW